MFISHSVKKISDLFLNRTRATVQRDGIKTPLPPTRDELLRYADDVDPINVAKAASAFH